MADYNIRLGVEVDTSNIQSQINGIKPDPINVQLNTRNLQNQINNIRQQLLDLNNIRINLGGLGNGGAGGNGGGRGARRQIDDTARAYRELISLQNRIGSKQQKVAKLDTSHNQREILELSNQIENLLARYQQIHSLFNGRFSSVQLDGLNRGFQVAGENLDAIREKAADVRAELARGINQNLTDGTFDKQIVNAETAMNKLSTVSDRVQASIDEVRMSFREMQSASSSGDNNSLIAANERYERALKSLNNQLSINIKTEQQLNSVDNLQLDKTSALLKLEGLFEDGSEAAKRFGSEVQRLRDEISQCANSSDMSKINKQVSNLSTQVKGSGLQTKTIGTRLKEQFDRYKSYLSVASVFMYATQGLKDMFQQVVAIDTAMTELKKVTNETDASYDKFLSNAAQRSKEIGTTIDGLVASTADFARLGYSFEESAGLAEVANIYTVVGDEIEGVEDATQSLVSTLAAFKHEMGDMSDSDFAMSIVDKFNEVSNNFAISSGGIGEALQRSASSMAAANNTLDETIALTTAANEVVQNPEKVGNALKTISMRIRGAKTELEEAGESTDGMAESTASLRAEMLALSGVDIMENDNTFKSTYQIMDELSQKWESLSDIQRATITELVAGKHQGNVMSSLMANFDTARAALETSLNSSGSALEEHGKWSDSLEARLNKLKATWQSLSLTFMDSSFLKGGISFVTGFVNVIDKIIDKTGVIFPILTAFAGKKIFSKIFDTAKTMQFAGGITRVGDVISILSASFPKLTAAASAFIGTLSSGGGIIAAFSAGITALNPVVLGIIAAVAAIGAGIAIYDKFTESAAELSKRVNDVTTKYKEQHKELTKLKGDYDTTNESSMISKYGELSKGVNALGENVSLTADEYAEYKSIVESIANTNPSLVEGYNSQGDAILSCAGNVDKLSESYKNLIREQNKEVLDIGEDIFKDFENDLDASSRYGVDKKDVDGHIKELEKLMNMTDEELEKFTSNDAQAMRISELLEQNGIKRDVLFSGEKGYESYSEHIIRAIREDKAEVESILNDASSDINAYAEDLSTVTEAYFSNAFLGDYSHLSDKMQNVINQIASNFDSGFYGQFLNDGNPYDSLTSYLDSVLSKFDSLSDADAAKFEAAFDLKTNFNGGEISYGEYVNSLQEAGKLIDNLGLDEEIENQIKLNFGLNEDGIVEEYQTLLNRLTETNADNVPTGNVIGLSDKEAKNFLDSLSAEELSVAMDIIPNLDAGTTVDKIRAMIEDKMAVEFKFDIKVQTEGIEALNTALSESRSATGLTTESINALMNRYQELDGFNASALFEKTANGIHLNNSELSRLEAQYENINKLDIDSNLNKLLTKYKELTEQIKNCTNEQEKESLQLQANAYADKIEELSILASQYEGVTSALNKWKSAQSAAEEGDDYDSLYGSLEEIKELAADGLVGTDKFKSAVQLMTNEDLSSASIEEYISAYKKGYPKMQRYFTEEKKGCENFLKDISKINSEWAHLNEDGKWEINIGDIEDVANETELNVESIYTILRKLKDYGFEVNLDIDNASIDSLQTKIQETEAKLKELGQEPVDINVDIEASSENLGTIKDEIEKAKSKISEINNSTVDPNVKTAQLEDAQAKLEALIEKKQEAGQPAFMNLNTSQVNASLVEALEKVQAYQTALNDLNKLSELKGAGITIDDSQITAAQEKANECAKAIQGLDGEVKVAIGLEEDGSVDSIKKAFEEGKVNIDANTDPAITKVEMLAENVERIEDKDVAINVTVNGLEDVKELNRQINLATNIEGDIDSLSKYVENAKKLNELDSNIATYVSANVKGNVIETPEYMINNLKTFADSASGLKDIGNITSNVTANIDGNVKDTAEFQINNLKVFTESAEDLSSIGNVTSSVYANIDGNVKDNFEFQINNLKTFTESAQGLENVGNVSASVSANIEGNVAWTPEGMINNLKEFASSAEAIRNTGEVKASVTANMDGDAIWHPEKMIDNLKVFAENAETIKEVGDVQASVYADIDGNVVWTPEGMINNLQEFAKSAEAIKDIGNIKASVSADVEGDVIWTPEGMLNNLKEFAEGANAIKDIGDVDASITANIDGDVIWTPEGMLNNLKEFAEGAETIRSTGDVSASVTANIDGDVIWHPEGMLNNLETFANGAEKIDSIGDVEAKVTANIDGDVIWHPEGMLNNLEVFADSAKKIDDVGDVEASISANINGDVIWHPEGMLNNLNAFADGAKKLDGVGDVKASVTANANGDAIWHPEGMLNNLNTFAEGAKAINGIGDVKASVSAEVNGDAIWHPEGMLNNLQEFANGANVLNGIPDEVNKTISANIEGDVIWTPEGMLNNVNAFAESAKTLDGIPDEINKTLSVNINGDVIWTPEGMINNVSVFAESAKTLNSVPDSVSKTVSADISGTVITTSENNINKLGTFADNAKKAQDVGNFTSSVTASINGNIITDDTAVSDLEYFSSVASGLSNQSISINVTANVDAASVDNAINSLTKVSDSESFKDYDANVSVTATVIGLDKINNLKTALSNIKDKTVNMLVKGAEAAVSAINSVKNALSGLKDKTIKIKADKSGSTQPEPVAKSTEVNYTLGDQDVPVDKSALVNYSLGTQEAPVSKTVTVNYKRGWQQPPLPKTTTVTYVRGTAGAVNGTANANGTAFANGTAGKAYKQGDWGTKGSGVALMGELGRETIVRDGRFFTVGDTGAGFYQYKKGDIIFNHKQTEELFKNGKVTSGGGRGKALVNGTAFAEGTAFSGGVTGSGSFTTVVSTNPVTGTDYTRQEGEGAEEFQETIDFIEIAIDRIERKIDSLDKAASNVYKTWADRNTALINQIGKVGEEIDIQQKAYDKYMQAAAGVGLSADWIRKIQDGSIEITSIDDEALKQQIDDYKEW